MSTYDKKIILKEKEILAIADEMAASVTSLTPQTYDTFLLSREKLKNKLHEFLTDNS